MIQKTPDISIVIPTFNSRVSLERTLGALLAAPVRRGIEVLVVDDGSSDGTKEMVKSRFPRVRLLVNPVNAGYAKSCNRAIALARGRFIHLLNNDVELHPGSIDALADFLDAHEDVGAVGSVLLNEDGSLQQNAKALPTLRSAFFGGRSWISKWMPNNRFTQRELQHWRAKDGVPFRAGYVSGASMMLPRRAMASVGELDEYLWHFNDADYCRRLWDAGYAVYLLPDAKAVHLEHQGGTRRTLKTRFWGLIVFHKSAYRYSRKHSGYAAWHPHQVFVLSCLTVRWVVTSLLQLLREATGIDRRIYGQR